MFAVTRKMLVSVIIVAGLCLSVGYYAGYRIGYDEGLRAVKTYRVGYLFADIHQIACFVARDQGFFDYETDLGFEFKEYANGPLQMTDFVAGELDMGYVGCVPALMNLSKGADFKIVASANLEGSAIAAKLDIENVEGLNGKRVGTPGTGTIQDTLLSIVENKLGISVTHKPYLGPSTLPLELERGVDIDAFIAWEPFCAEAVVEGIGRVVYTSHDIMENHPCCVFYISGKILREDRGLAVRLVRAHVKAMEFVKENENGAMEIFAARTGKSMDVVGESWKRMVWDYTPNVESMKTFTKSLIDAGKIEAGDVPDIDAFVENAVDLTLLADALK